MLRLSESGHIVDDEVLQIGNLHQIAGEINDVLVLKSRVIEELEKEGFPDLEFLFSPKVIAIIEDVLNTLLQETEEHFDDICSLKDDEINMDIFFTQNNFEYLFALLKSFKDLDNNKRIRGILDRFNEKYTKYKNKISYSKRFYEVQKFLLSQVASGIEEKRLLEISIKDYEMAGINLDLSKQERLKKINMELSQLSDNYNNNLSDAEEQVNIQIIDISIIEDMPKDSLDIAKNRAEKLGKDGFVFGVNQTGSVMRYCSDRAIRQSTHQMICSLAAEGELSNREIVIKMLTLRNEKAKILGYSNHAELAMGKKMSDDYREVKKQLDMIYDKAKIIADEDISDIKKHFGLVDLQAYDYSFYMRKYEEEKNDFDISTVKPYLEVEHVIGGMFKIVKKLFNIDFVESNISTYGDGNIYEVYKEGEMLGYLWCDFYSSDKKIGGAWAESIRKGTFINNEGKRIKKKKIVINGSNISKNSEGDTLLSFSNVETLFHELGHGLHELCYKGDFSSLSGLNGEDDFIELPSQLLENWCRTPEGLKYIAKHHITGDEMPKEMIDNILKSNSFHSAYGIMHVLKYTYYDLSLHSQDIPDDGSEFDRFSLGELRSRSVLDVQDYVSLYANFDHPFYEPNSMYAAGYFSYIWAEIIEKDIWEVFKNSDDVFNPVFAQKYMRIILEQGFQYGGKELFYQLMGREVDSSAYLKSKNLIK